MRPGFWIGTIRKALPAFGLAFTSVLLSASAHAQVLGVDNSLGNSPFAINAGDSIVNQQTQVGTSTGGVINQTGGDVSSTVQPGASIFLGIAPGVTGTWNLSGGTVTSPFIQVGILGGTGIFNQSAGTVTAVGSSGEGLLIGRIDGIGTYNLTGGDLSASTVNFGLGGSGTGTFNLDGGTLSTAIINESGGT